MMVTVCAVAHETVIWNSMPSVNGTPVVLFSIELLNFPKDDTLTGDFRCSSMAGGFSQGSKYSMAPYPSNVSIISQSVERQSSLRSQSRADDLPMLSRPLQDSGFRADQQR